MPDGKWQAKPSEKSMLPGTGGPPARLDQPSSTESTRRLVPLAEALAEVGDGDLLLYRRLGLVARIGRGVHSHAAMAAWWHGELFVLEVTPWYGGRAVTLRSQLKRYPGRIDLFVANPDGAFGHFDRRGAVRAMQQLMGLPYGWRRLVGLVLRRLPLGRLILPAQVVDPPELAGGAICSQAVAWATRTGGGVDPVPHLADHATEPADLARSLFYRYRLTFVP